MKHFGIKLTDRGKGFKLNKDNFALINTKPSLPFFKSLAKRNAYTDEFGTSYTDKWCNDYRELCLKNYDFNIEFFSLLNSEDFKNVLECFLEEYNEFEEVFDLTEYSEVEGFYIMVLDEYKQVYIGKTENIKKRIMQHWSKSKPFDRTLFPMYAYNKSCFSIDFFRALDTTRIFVWKHHMSVGIEEDLIRSFPAKYCTNRIGGDITDAIQAIASANIRQLESNTPDNS
jgi:hypothetical protein